MKVYRHESRGRRFTLYIKPGLTHPVTDWLDPKGVPVQMAVPFVDGVADIEDNLAQYLIDNGHAVRSMLILPSGVL